jgi:hypothetical protein
MIHEHDGAVDRMSMDGSLRKAGEAREGMRALAEKRSPAWVPRRSTRMSASVARLAESRAIVDQPTRAL